MNVVLFLYNLIYIILFPFVLIFSYIICKIKGYDNSFLERFGIIKLNQAPYTNSIWFHCASVGEVKSISNIVSAIRAKYKDIHIIVSTMTKTGRNEAKNFIKADEAFLLPIENSAAISHIIKLLGVTAFFIVDTEIWPNLINAVSINTRLIMINGKISEKSFKSYYKFRLFFRPLFKKFSAILTKSNTDYNRFEKILGSNKNLASLGNIKFQRRKNITEVAVLEEFKNIKYFLAASTHHNEEEIMTDAFIDVKDSFDKFIIVPRHINRSEEIKNMVLSKGLNVSLYSEKENTKVIIIDTFGLLENLYINASKIFIGGSLINIGGHNIYEALQFEKYIAVGKYMQDFEEIFTPALNYNIVEIVEDKYSIVNWLQKDDKNGNFKDFFVSIDTQNSKILKVIEDLINDVLPA